MAGFETLISELRRAEQQIESQLAGVRKAISLLEGGSAADNGAPRRKSAVRPVRKKRKLSAKARAAISAAQKARWARQRGAEKASR